MQVQEEQLGLFVTSRKIILAIDNRVIFKYWGQDLAQVSNLSGIDVTKLKQIKDPKSCMPFTAECLPLGSCIGI